jgi:hypothetical protein
MRSRSGDREGETAWLCRRVHSTEYMSSTHRHEISRGDTVGTQVPMYRCTGVPPVPAVHRQGTYGGLRGKRWFPPSLSVFPSLAALFFLGTPASDHFLPFLPFFFPGPTVIFGVSPTRLRSQNLIVGITPGGIPGRTHIPLRGLSIIDRLSLLG